MPETTFTILVYIWIALGVLLFPLLLKISAPYGRHSRSGWGITIPNHLGWFVMELPALVVFAYFFLAGSNRQSAVTWLFFSSWVLHYTNRTLVFPFRIKIREKRIPALIVGMGFGFNLVNGFFNGYYFGSLAPHYPQNWFVDSRFFLGISLFLTGLGINWWSDSILLGLRNSGQKHYSIPQRGLFRAISCPNYLGEIVEWGGFALMGWSLPALSFFIWTVVNLIPRALDHHRWYKEQFESYPERRKALIPFLL
jgi:hypothetical protein